jgi:hypothetical protein
VKDSERLIERLRGQFPEFDFDRAKFEKLRPGHWQRSAGAWKWTLLVPPVGSEGVYIFGSQWPLYQLFSVEDWSIRKDSVEYHVDPVGEVCPERVPKRKPVHISKSVEVKCPVEGCGVVVSRSSMLFHLRLMHEWDGSQMRAYLDGNKETPEP